MSKQNCRKSLLASLQGMNVYYCHDCQVAHLELGALSIRLEPLVMLRLEQLLQSANVSLSHEHSWHAAQLAKDQADSLIMRLRRTL